MSIEILDCLKRKRDICAKAVITSQTTAFMWTPALNSCFMKRNSIENKSKNCESQVRSTSQHFTGKSEQNIRHLTFLLESTRKRRRLDV